MEQSQMSENLYTQAQALNRLGDSSNKEGQFQQALRYYERAYILLDQGKYTAESALTLQLIAAIYYRHQQWSAAIDCATKALKRYEQTKGNFIAQMADLLTTLAVCYANADDDKNAADSYTRALTLFNHMGDRTKSAALLHYMGQTYSNLRRFEQALSYYLRALVLAEQLNDITMAANIYHCIGHIFSAQRQWAPAMKHFNRALSLYESAGPRYRQHVIRMLDALENCYGAQGNVQKATEYYTRARQLSWTV